MLNKLSRAPIAAALLAVLAACGGGDDNDTATSTSPRTPERNGTASTPANPARNGSTPTNDTVLPSGNGAAHSTDSRNGTTAPSQTGNISLPPAPAGNLVLDVRTSAAISSNGIRGDVLLTSLSQQACSGPLSAVTGLDGPRVRGADELALPVIGAGTELSPSNYVLRPDAANIVSPLAGLCQRMRYQAPLDGRVYELNIFSNPVYRYSPSATQGFHYLDADLQLAITAEAFALSATADADNTEDRGRTFQTQEAAEQEVQLSAGGITTIHRDALVPFNTSRTWTNGNHRIEMLVLPADAPNRFRQCWSVDLHHARRLQCTVWAVPATWRYGSELQFVDQYLVDDRSSYPGEAEGSFRYFRTDER